jgi:hypothetical protein
MVYEEQTDKLVCNFLMAAKDVILFLTLFRDQI